MSQQQPISPLRRRMIEDITVRNLWASTQHSYVYAVANFSRHFGRSSDQLGLEEVRAYQLHLVGLKRSWPHINQVTCALRFFYAVTLGRKEAIERMAELCGWSWAALSAGGGGGASRRRIAATDPRSDGRARCRHHRRGPCALSRDLPCGHNLGIPAPRSFRPKGAGHASREIQPVTRPSCSPASGPIDNYLGEILPH
jgi:hypothetical protein